MAILRYIFTITNSPYLIKLFLVLTVESVYTRDQRRCADCGSGQWSAEYLGSAEKLRIFRGRYIVGP